MRVLLQRVTRAEVKVEGQLISEIGAGLLIFVGIEASDGPDDIDWLTRKICKMRIFEDADGKMNRSLIDLMGEALVVSQFTLHAETKKGNRPSFIKAARPELAIPLYESFCDRLEALMNQPVKKGIFGADMKVSLLNDGPVSIIIDSKNRE